MFSFVSYILYRCHHIIIDICDEAVFVFDEYGKVIAIEVGALLVGRITDHGLKTFAKGDEKGYFETGGSTIVYVVERDRLKLRNDIITKLDNEIRLRCGQRIEEM